MDGERSSAVAPRSSRSGILSGPREIPVEKLSSASRAVSGELREPAWLLKDREEALERYAARPLPDRVSHLWRYTAPEEFLPAASSCDGNGGSAPAGALPAQEIGDWPPEIRAPLESGDIAGAAVVSGGSLRKVAIDPELRRAGVIIDDLHAMARERPDLVQGRLGSLVGSDFGKFEALNAALWRGGILIYVPRGVVVAKPFHILNITGGGIEARRNLIVAGEASDLTVIDEYTGGGAGKCQLFTVLEDFAGPASRLRHVVVQRLGGTVALHMTQRARASRDGKVLSVWASLGGAISKADLGTLLDGPGAEVELLGFLFAQGRQHFDHHTVHDHRSGSTQSNLDFKVVLKDRSRSAYTGLIRIAPGAPKSEAYQENRNLLLNEGARAETIPELEILTDEVLCTHGATVGSLDPEHLFYLQSRGIPPSEAKRMIVGGFVEPTLNRLPGDLRERLRRHVEAGLAGI